VEEENQVKTGLSNFIWKIPFKITLIFANLLLEF